MNSLSQLSAEEYRKICSVIPHRFIVGYFQKNPKEFNKLYPGHRAISVSNKRSIELLVTYRERGYISSFVEKIVNNWLKGILAVVQDYQENGETEIVANIHALYQSFFSDNVSAYFKLIGRDCPADQLEIISGMISLLKGIEIKQRELKASSIELKNKLNDSKRESAKNEELLDKLNKQLANLTIKMNELKVIQKQYQESLSKFEQVSKEKESALIQIASLEKKVASLNDNLSDLQQERDELEIKIRARIKEEKEQEALLTQVSFPLAPVDMGEFEEFFSYNLESLGVRNSILPVNRLLTAYMSNILFQGKPIICNKISVESLAKCISNTLIGNAPINTISFSANYDEGKLYSAIKHSGRIVVLDNFLGNYNETVLLTILERFKSKIIILSVVYEKTLLYLPREFLAYSCYVNLSHVSSFIKALKPDEDPSILEEREVLQYELPAKNRHQDIIISIAMELGYSRLLSEKISEFICNDTSACAMLAFNLIPYVDEVLGKNAFNISESLQRYIGRSPYKEIFEEWFMS